MRISRVVPALALAAASVITLSGCSVMEFVRQESTAHYNTRVELMTTWSKTAPWLPTDAFAIDVRESTSGEQAMLRAASAQELDPLKCVQTERLSAPVFNADWAPDPYVDQIFVCGVWAVMETPEGWYGWTPIHPDEAAAAVS